MPRTAGSVVELAVSIRDLTEADLPRLGWSGSALHVQRVAEQLERARAGVVDYLVACVPSGASVGKGGIDYEERPGAGSLTQFAVHGLVQSCGIGSALISVAEDRIRARGLTRAEIDVEVDNPRARALYERLGYVAYDTQPAGWDQQLPDGTITWYETTCVQLRKQLA